MPAEDLIFYISSIEGNNAISYLGQGFRTASVEADMWTHSNLCSGFGA